MPNMNPESFSSSFGAAIEQIAGLGAGEDLTKLDKSTYDDRYSFHNFTYSNNYVVGAPGSPRASSGGPNYS